MGKLNRALRRKFEVHPVAAMIAKVDVRELAGVDEVVLYRGPLCLRILGFDAVEQLGAVVHGCVGASRGWRSRTAAGHSG